MYCQKGVLSLTAKEIMATLVTETYAQQAVWQTGDVQTLVEPLAKCQLEKTVCQRRVVQTLVEVCRSLYNAQFASWKALASFR